jgi:hypothetical protein
MILNCNRGFIHRTASSAPGAYYFAWRTEDRASLGFRPRGAARKYLEQREAGPHGPAFFVVCPAFLLDFAFLVAGFSATL